MFSRYVRTSKRSGVVAVFHELHPSPVYMDIDVWNRIIETNIVPQEYLGAFSEKGLVISDESEDDKVFACSEYDMLSKLEHATILYLMTAQGCDFDCGYCPVQEIAKKHGPSYLSKESAYAGIDLWQSHLKDSFDATLDYYVIFYGGEPLLNKSIITESLTYLEQLKLSGSLPDQVKYMVATNGAGVDKSFVDLCLRYQVSVAVGLDGSREENDALKVDLEGGSTFDRIVHAIQLLVDSGVPTYASCSITPFNLDSIHNMSNFFKNLGVRKFGFNFLRGKKLIDLVGSDGIERYYKTASRAVIENARNQGESGFEFQMEKKAVAYEKGDFFPLDCTCYGNQLVIQPDGQISNCPFFKARLGNVRSVDDGFRIGNQSIVHEWRKKLPLYHKGTATALSGGGCTWGLLDLNSNPTTTDIGSRIFAEEVLDEFIWNTYRNR